MQVHLNAAQIGQAQEGELSLNFIKKYIGYCRKYVINKLLFFLFSKFNSPQYSENVMFRESLFIEERSLHFCFL